MKLDYCEHCGKAVKGYYSWEYTTYYNGSNHILCHDCYNRSWLCNCCYTRFFDENREEKSIPIPIEFYEPLEDVTVTEHYCVDCARIYVQEQESQLANIKDLIKKRIKQ